MRHDVSYGLLILSPAYDCGDAMRAIETGILSVDCLKAAQISLHAGRNNRCRAAALRLGHVNVPIVRINLRILQEHSDVFFDGRAEIVARSVKSEQACGLWDQILASDADGCLNNLKHCEAIFEGSDLVGSAQR